MDIEKMFNKPVFVAYLNISVFMLDIFGREIVD